MYAIRSYYGLWYTSDAEVGYFAVSRSFADILLLLYGAIGPLVLSYVSGMTASEDYHPFIGRVCRVSILAFSGIAILIGCAAPRGVPRCSIHPRGARHLPLTRSRDGRGVPVRLTSYNVCYTKLLRERQPIEILFLDQGRERFRQFAFVVVVHPQRHGSKAGFVQEDQQSQSLIITPPP